MRVPPAPLHGRLHPGPGRTVIAIHGGPAAPGSLGDLARPLSAHVRVIEPYQRGSGATPLTVDRHIGDLHRVIIDHSGGRAPILLGHSWGAMLALAYASVHPDTIAILILVGCGTFDASARAAFVADFQQRLDPATRDTLARLHTTIADDDARMTAAGRIISQVYAYDPLDLPEEPVEVDARAQRETWRDMLQCQTEGRFPATFAAITAPVAMLHGADDPHPGELIRRSLAPVLPQLHYRTYPRCGHEPWRERHAREAFLADIHALIAAAPRGVRPGFAGLSTPARR